MRIYTKFEIILIFEKIFYKGLLIRKVALVVNFNDLFHKVQHL